MNGGPGVLKRIDPIRRHILLLGLASRNDGIILTKTENVPCEPGECGMRMVVGLVWCYGDPTGFREDAVGVEAV